MPLRCVDEQGWSLHAFDLTEEQWDALADQNRLSRALRMPCCGAEVLLKRSKRHLKFFAHKAAGGCETAPESEEHLFLKCLAVEAARAAGWEARTEVDGRTPNGDFWRADVLATNGRHKIAVEIQWSGQTREETRARQARYAASGVRGLWLFRQPRFEISAEVPAVCIGGVLGGSFVAMLPARDDLIARDRMDPAKWQQRIPMPEFLQAVFERRFSYGPPTGSPCTITAVAATQKCWRRACGQNTRLMVAIEIEAGGQRRQASMDFLGRHREFVARLEQYKPASVRMGPLKLGEPENTVDDGFPVENTCASCGWVIHVQPNVWLDQEGPVYSFELAYDRVTKAVLDDCGWPRLHWQVTGVTCERPGARSANVEPGAPPNAMRRTVLGLPAARSRPR